MNYVSPDKVFLFLVNSSGAIALLVYLVIAVSQLRMRQKLERENSTALKIKMWLFPYLTYFTILALLVILASMLFIESMISQLLLTLLITAVVIVYYFVFARRHLNPNYQPATPTPAKD